MRYVSGVLVSSGGVGSNPTSDRVLFFIGKVSQPLVFGTNMLMMWYHVRIAEWSKAPDSRTIIVHCFGVLVSSGGVGSNPTSDRDFFF